MNQEIERDATAERNMNTINGKFTPSQPKVAKAKAKSKMFSFKPSSPKVGHVTEPLLETGKAAESEDDMSFIEAESKMSVAARSELALMNKAVVSDKESRAM